MCQIAWTCGSRAAAQTDNLPRLLILGVGYSNTMLQHLVDKDTIVQFRYTYLFLIQSWFSNPRTHVNSDWKRIGQKYTKDFNNKKFGKQFSFCTCILPDYMSHESSKEFRKNSLLKTQKLVSF